MPINVDAIKEYANNTNLLPDDELVELWNEFYKFHPEKLVYDDLESLLAANKNEHIASIDPQATADRHGYLYCWLDEDMNVCAGSLPDVVNERIGNLNDFVDNLLKAVEGPGVYSPIITMARLIMAGYQGDVHKAVSRTGKGKAQVKVTPEDFGFMGGIKNLHNGIIGWCCDNACTFYTDKLEHHAKEKYDNAPRFTNIFVKEDNDDERDAFCRMLCEELGIEDFGRV